MPKDSAAAGKSSVRKPISNSSPRGVRHSDAEAQDSDTQIRRDKRIFEDVKIVSLDPDCIEGMLVRDRVDGWTSKDDELLRSIENSRQLDPIIVRPLSKQQNRYHLVSGQRRLKVIRRLGWHVQAQIVRYSEDYAIQAQVNANLGRIDLSFIDRAIMANDLFQKFGGLKAASIMHVDETLISKMRSAIEPIPAEVIDLIGPASGIGRPRWEKIAELLREHPLEPKEIVALASAMDDSKAEGDARFHLIRKKLEVRAAPNAGSTSLAPPLTTRWKGDTLHVKVRLPGRPDLETTIIEAISKLIESLPEKPQPH